MTSLKEQQLVDEFVITLKRHDWYYDYAEDFGAFKVGMESKKKLMDLFRKIIDSGMDVKAAVDIYNEYAPENYKLDTKDIG